MSRRAAVQRWVLLAIVAGEVIIFGRIGTHFFTLANLLQIPRLNVELGLIALAQTAVILSGGLDLSVGSLLGLCAVVFGKLWRDGGLGPSEAAAITLGVGALCGGINALLITRGIPPLIVTLGSFSLFRGIAEGMTGGVDNFTNFPRSFLLLGQGYWGPIPAQVPVLVAAAVFFYLLVHRSALGRALSAIGYSPQGARWAGIAVGRKLAAVYVLSGLCAAAAALIYVARVGQAKADAGMGYELAAITAVVLGGTSIFGGRASVLGTVLGLLAIALLDNGLRLADRSPELAGILKGVLLLAAIGIDWRPRGGAAGRRQRGRAEEPIMRNTQLAVLVIVILAAAAIITGGNFLMYQSFSRQLAAQGRPREAGKRLTIAMMPKSKGNAYFIACQKGAAEAADELGVKLLWDGPMDSDPARQNEIVETWITRGVDVIAVSVENRGGLSTALRKARQCGIKVITWDADADRDARDFFVNQATPQGIGQALMDAAAKSMDGRGDFAIITASLTAANQNEWKKYIEQRLATAYPEIHLVDFQPCDDQQAKAFEQARTILNVHPEVKLIMAICSPAAPGAAEAVKQSGRNDVKVVGLGLPNENKPYVHEGITDAVILWNTMDLGYLTVYAADALARGTLAPGQTSLEAGRLGRMQVRGDDVLLGAPFWLTKSNIDQFDF
ncbi:MAG: substrate-binding domain-containing protein [Tepidisphaeraceae bacterium]|jgi:rhamnose transport system permease protein